MIDLVTGATGFVGSHLVEDLLARGRRVRCTVRRTSDTSHLARLGVETVEADLADAPPPPAAFDGVERVFHVAGLVVGSEAAFRRVNATATFNLVRAMPLGLRLVHVSTLAVCGPNPDETPFDESVEPRPVSVYGRTKLAGERAALAAGATVIRPPVVYGPRDRGLLSFFQAAAFRIRPLMSGLRRISIVHVADLARGIADAADAPPGRVYFLANDESPELDEMTALILRSMGVRRAITVRLWPRVMFDAAAIVERLPLGLPLSRDKVREMRRRYWLCRADAARRDFGWTPSVPLEAGIRQAVAWYRTHGWI